jgi:vitamin B12 transporter
MDASPDTGQWGACRRESTGHDVRARGEACRRAGWIFSFMLHHPYGLRAAIVLCCACSCAFAQPDAPTTIVVTAARVDQPLADALPSTRVITRTEIEATPSPDVAALLRALTSIDVAQSGPLGAQTSLFLRGADSRQVLLLVDGVPFARADTGSSSWQYLPLDQIERIEIVRGNLSSLYGAQAIGGVVRIETRRAAQPTATLALGSQGRRQASVAAGTRWGDGDRTTRVSAALSTQRSDGWSARDAKADPSVNPDRDAARQHGGSVRFDQGWAAGHATQLALGTSRTSSDYDGFDPTAIDRLDTRVHTLALTTRHALAPDWRLHAEAGATRERFDDPTGFTTEGDSRVRNLALAAEWTVAPSHELQFGAESRQDRFDVPGASSRERTTRSLRIGWQGRPIERWQWQAHLRRDRSSDFGPATTGLVAGAWEFAPRWKASLQASSGFSAPSFTEQAFDADPSTPLRAEHSRQAEAALQWRDGAASARVALFVQRQRDRIDFDPVTFDATNVARARNHGLEAMVQWPLAGGLLGAEATLQDPRNADDDAPLLRRAKRTLALNWSGPIAGWQARAGLRHAGARQDVDPVSFGVATARARTTLSLGASRPLTPQWRLALSADNVLDSTRPEVLGYTAPPRALLVSLQGTLN